MKYSERGIDPYFELSRYVAQGVEGAPSVQEMYLENHGPADDTERFWNDTVFGLGFEYGLLALAAILAKREQDENE